MQPVQEANGSSASSDSLASEPSEVCSHMGSQASSSAAESDEHSGIGSDSRGGRGPDSDDCDDCGEMNAGGADKDQAGLSAEDAELSCPVCGRELEMVTRQETLDCDGGCGRQIPPEAMRFSCQLTDDCDWDVCQECADAPRPEKAAPPPLPPPPSPAPLPPTAPLGATVAPPPPPARPANARGEADMNASQACLPPPSKTPRTRPPQRGDVDHRPLSERLGPFLAFRAEWARKRAAAAAADAEMPEDSGVTAFTPDALASTGSPTPIGAAPLMAAVPSVHTLATDPAAAQTPPTTFAPHPPMDPVSLAPPGEELRRQAATLLGSGEESRRRAIAFAREVMALVPSEFSGEVSEAGAVVSRPGGEVGPSALGTGGLPPASFSVPLGWMRSPVVATYRPRCFCCDSTFGNGESHRCAGQLTASPCHPTPTPQPTTPQTSLTCDLAKLQVCSAPAACHARGRPRGAGDHHPPRDQPGQSRHGGPAPRRAEDHLPQVCFHSVWVSGQGLPRTDPGLCCLIDSVPVSRAGV